MTELEEARARGAAEEREAILTLLERSMRVLAHGHGANGAEVMQRLADDIRARGRDTRG